MPHGSKTAVVRCAPRQSAASCALAPLSARLAEQRFEREGLALELQRGDDEAVGREHLHADEGLGRRLERCRKRRAQTLGCLLGSPSWRRPESKKGAAARFEWQRLRSKIKQNGHRLAAAAGSQPAPQRTIL